MNEGTVWKDGRRLSAAESLAAMFAAQTCQHTDAERAAAGCPVCLRAERDKLVAQHGRDTGIIFSLRGEVDEWKRNAEKQYANLQNVTVLTTKLQEERDRLRQALERIANDYKHGLLTYQTWAREALGAKEDRP